MRRQFLAAMSLLKNRSTNSEMHICVIDKGVQGGTGKSSSMFQSEESCSPFCCGPSRNTDKWKGCSPVNEVVFFEVLTPLSNVQGEVHQVDHGQSRWVTLNKSRDIMKPTKNICTAIAMTSAQKGNKTSFYRLWSGFSEKSSQISTFQELQHYELWMMLEAHAQESNNVPVFKFAANRQAETWKARFFSQQTLF